MSAQEFTTVDDAASLDSLAAALESSAWHGLDTESNSGFAYAERLCVLQMHVDRRLWLVDLVALEGRLLIERIRPSLESSERVTCLHGGEFDVGCLKRDYDIQLAGVWDTQQAASFLGWPQTGYAAVVEKVTGVQLRKAYTQHDWARRPLTEEVLDYALDDVRYLPAIYDRLRELIVEADLEEELAIAHRAVEESVWTGGFRPDGFWKVKGVGNLRPDQLPSLVAMWSWRDEIARKVDRPPGRVLNNRALLALASRPPRNRRELRRAGLPGRIRGRAEELLGVLEEARRHPPEVPPKPGVRPRGQLGGNSRRRETRLSSWRAEEAARRGVPLQVVLPSKALAHLKRHGPSDLQSVPQLGEKRIRRYGEQLRQLLE